MNEGVTAQLELEAGETLIQSSFLGDGGKLGFELANIRFFPQIAIFILVFVESHSRRTWLGI